MKLENIYAELKGIVVDNEFNFMKYQKLLDKIEEKVRLESSYKTTSKTRANAIKRVASDRNDRPVLTGYGVRNGYKVVTDSYHLIAIHEENMPLPLVATPDELKEMGIDYKEYIEKNGRNSLINGNYPNMDNLLKFNTSKELDMIDLDDLQSFCKLHKKDKELYKIGDKEYNPHFVKNIIDVLGKDVRLYDQGINRPLFIVNNKDEIGLVLPVRKY